MFFCTQHLYIATSNLVPRRGPSGINNEVSMGDEASRPVRRRSSVRLTAFSHTFVGEKLNHMEAFTSDHVVIRRLVKFASANL